MKKVLILLVSFFLLPSLLMAQSLQEERRVEETKRENLQSSETSLSPEKPKKAKSQPLDPVDMIYFAELVPRRIAFGYDACKAVVVLMGVDNKYIDLESQVSFLKENKLLPNYLESGFDPMKPLRKGVLAYMFCKVLDIKGGILLRLLGMNQRYALKELVYQGIMSSGNEKDIVSGEELVLTLTRAVSY